VHLDAIDFCHPGIVYQVVISESATTREPRVRTETENDCLMIRASLLLLLLCSTVLSAQSIPARPSFEDYPAKRIFNGAPAPPTLDRDERMFRTVIR
jgi:hypothetical protein